MKRSLLSILMAAVLVLTLGGSAFAQVPPAGAAAGSSVMVLAGDPDAGPHNLWVAPFVSGMEDWLAQGFGWRSAQPVRVVTYAEVQPMLVALAATQPSLVATMANQSQATRQEAFLVRGMVTDMSGGASVQAGNGWVIIVNLSGGLTAPNMMVWQMEVREAIAREYARIMIIDQASSSVPNWMSQGLIDAITFRLVPGTATESRINLAANSTSFAAGTPSMMQVESGAGLNVDSRYGVTEAARGLGLRAVNNLLNRMGGMQVVQLISRVKGGENVESVLRSMGVEFGQLLTR